MSSKHVEAEWLFIVVWNKQLTDTLKNRMTIFHNFSYSWTQTKSLPMCDIFFLFMNRRLNRGCGGNLCLTYLRN